MKNMHNWFFVVFVHKIDSTLNQLLKWYSAIFATLPSPMPASPAKCSAE